MSKASRKFGVPDPLANLYDFANTLDLRHFVENGVRHQQSDELSDPSALDDWMRERRLAERGAVPSQKMFDQALRLRSTIRNYLKCDPIERSRRISEREALNGALEPFLLRVKELGNAGMRLVAAETGMLVGLSVVVAELYDGASNGTLDRLKMCAADDCQRVFYDRSKPGTRRWCKSTLCGNREKTRTYRERQKDEISPRG